MMQIQAAVLDADQTLLLCAAYCWPLCEVCPGKVVCYMANGNKSKMLSVAETAPGALKLESIKGTLDSAVPTALYIADGSHACREDHLSFVRYNKRAADSGSGSGWIRGAPAPVISHKCCGRLLDESSKTWIALDGPYPQTVAFPGSSSVNASRQMLHTSSSPCMRGIARRKGSILFRSLGPAT